ncbi:MAG: hypothetical protein BM563_06395 [Bacteroidetes bacterium MedPE-SWsnd-G1]|nr:MAG: hypothetical protein BM563_06395 [Bacteroidetes bacterium MedPE-SWsnd-G1]
MKLLKIAIFVVASTLLISCGGQKSTTASNNKVEPVKFHINLNDRSNDTFKVTVTAPELTSENNIYQFASTAPGTYTVMNIGRFVKTFEAFDDKGNPIETNKVSVNQYEFAQPEKVASINYEISETFDTEVKELPIYPMCGTSIEENHALINAHAVLGYFKGKQATPMNIKIDYPENWLAGTALTLNSDNSYSANTFDHAVDSPILLGELTTASMEVSGTKVDILTYSEKGMITSEMVLESMKDMIISADKFLGGLPVDRYTFLFHFETNGKPINGAWEHSYSSEYTNQEKPWNEIEQNMKDMASHEFFHIVTPLNIHSEIIQEFNFIQPVPSRHLWLYEGTTEWAAHMMQFKAGQKSMDDYLKMLRRKVYISEQYYKSEFSLLDLSLKSFTKEGHEKYGDIYMGGALVAGLLDIRLLELSNGEKGLSDVINQLAKIYGPNKAFDDATFFQYFTDFTYPEIGDFLNSYVKEKNALPYKEYYQKVGISFNAEDMTFTLDENASEKQLTLRSAWAKQLD